MPRTVVQPLPHDLAVVAGLEAIGRPVGFAQAPADALNSSGLPVTDYLVLYPLNSVRDGSMGDPYADVEFVYQITIVGKLPDGVRWLSGRLETALLTVAVTGRHVAQVIPEDDGQVLTDRDVGPPHPYYSTPRYRIVTTPA